MSLKCDGRHEHVPCAGRETLHTQIYTSKIVSIVLEEQHRRCSDIEIPIVNLCTAGSSGDGNKRNQIASPCVRVMKPQRNDTGVNKQSSITSHIRKQLHKILVPVIKILSKRRLRWIHSLLPKRKRDPNRGNSSSGAIGAGRAARADGQKTCLEAMAASGSGTRPQTGGGDNNRPKLFARDDDINGSKYVRMTGAMMESLIESEQSGRVVLPAKIGSAIASISSAENWITFGVPMVLIAGLIIGEVTTNKDMIIPTFKRVIRNIRMEDMSLNLEEAVTKMRKICQAITLVVDNYLKRECTNDVCVVQPILDRLADAQQLSNAGPGLQNLLDAIRSRSHPETIGDFIGVNYAANDTYLNQRSPLYTLRQAWWLEIFNLGMRSNPAGGMLQLDTLEEMTMILGKLLRQLVFCIRAYNFEFRDRGANLSVVFLARDIISLYSGSTAAAAYTVPSRAVATNCLTGISALLDIIRCYFTEKDAFIRTQTALHGIEADARAATSKFWAEFLQHEREAQEWFGMNDRFKNISFNVLGVERNEPAEVRRKNHNLKCWEHWEDLARGGFYDIAYQFDDGRPPPEADTVCPFGVRDPRPRGSSSGPRSTPHQSGQPGTSGPSAPPPGPKPQPKARPKPAPKKSNLSAVNPPPPAMFSEDSLSADEDEHLTLSNNEWTYPKIHLAGRKMKSLRRKHMGSGDKDVVILFCTNQCTTEDPCGSYDEALVPTEAAFDMVSPWEVLLRRTTIYLCTWADGIVAPRILRKYIDKYRYIWFRSQSNYLGVFPSPKTFALATCTDQPADSEKRRQLIDQTVLPPGQTKVSIEVLSMRTERVIIVSDLPLKWKSNKSVENDIPTVIEQWGWNNVQQYSPSNYDPKVDYLVQACDQVADLLQTASQEDDIKGATIHVWIAMTDII